ncbi:hypothetical protein SDC9_168308 [bioreactor metagenome]|uniref:Uncharacterized protein n=1 Tax=bioreactor metagenome TaxID=1076179 RepID=A0A645G558_9ZZZZ
MRKAVDGFPGEMRGGGADILVALVVGAVKGLAHDIHARLHAGIPPVNHLIADVDVWLHGVKTIPVLLKCSDSHCKTSNILFKSKFSICCAFAQLQVVPISAAM